MKTFAMQSHLKNHINTVHEGIKPYPCDKCDYKSPTQYYLTRHKKVSD
jgi:uncharacterized Zn-finger protein